MPDDDQIVQITVPTGYGPGQTVVVQAPDGHKMQITIPNGVFGGQQLKVAIPRAAEPAAPRLPRPGVERARAAARNSVRKMEEESGLHVDLTGEEAEARHKLSMLMERAKQDGLDHVTPQSAQEILVEATGHVGRALNILKARYPTGAGAVPAAAQDDRGDGRSTGRLGSALIGLDADGNHAALVLEQAVWGPNTVDAMLQRLRDPLAQPSTLLASSAAVAPSALSVFERQAIEGALEALGGDSTSNYKLRRLEEMAAAGTSRALPARLSRAQAAALLRCFEIPHRREDAIRLLRPRLELDEDGLWADELCGATTAEIRMLCGEAESERASEPWAPRRVPPGM